MESLFIIVTDQIQERSTWLYPVMPSTLHTCTLIPSDANLGRTCDRTNILLSFQTPLRLKNRVLAIVVQIMLRSRVDPSDVAVQDIAVTDLLHGIAVACTLA